MRNVYWVERGEMSLEGYRFVSPTFIEGERQSDNVKGGAWLHSLRAQGRGKENGSGEEGKVKKKTAMHLLLSLIDIS
jgi:hypothetical protein